MITFDVGVLLQAFMPLAEHHEMCRTRVEMVVDSGEPFAVSDMVLAAVVRIATNPRVFKPTPSIERAFEFTAALRDHERAVSIAPGTRHWGIFRDLVESTGITGSDTTDAYLAALALEHGCEWWTTDADFERFAGLAWKNLLAT